MGNNINTNTSAPMIYTVKRPSKTNYSTLDGLSDIGRTLSQGGAVYSASTTAKYAAGSARLTEVAPFVAKNTGRAVLAIGAAYGAYETYQAYEEGGTSAAIKKGTCVAGGLAMSCGCAKMGAVIGSAAGPAGAAAGAIIGGVVGYFAGEKVIETIQWIYE